MARNFTRLFTMIFIAPISIILWMIVFMLLMTAANYARADESYDGPHHFSVSFRTETNVTEALWQAENVVDLQQTLRIAEDPEHHHECGTLGLLTGPHPSAGEVWVGSVAAAVAHYYVTHELERLGEKYPAFRTISRVWSYGSLGYKTWNMERNARVGLGY